MLLKSIQARHTSLSYKSKMEINSYTLSLKVINTPIKATLASYYQDFWACPLSYSSTFLSFLPNYGNWVELATPAIHPHSWNADSSCSLSPPHSIIHPFCTFCSFVCPTLHADLHYLKRSFVPFLFFPFSMFLLWNKPACFVIHI